MKQTIARTACAVAATISSSALADVYTIGFEPVSDTEMFSWNTAVRYWDPTWVAYRYREQFGVTFTGLLNDLQNGGRLLRRLPEAPFQPRSGFGYFGMISEGTTVSESVGFPQQILFDAAQAQVSMWLLNFSAFTSFLPGVPQGSSTGVTITAFDHAGSVVSISSFNLLGNGLWQQFGISAPGDVIRRIVLTTTNPDQQHYLLMDDLSFTAVPAPGTAAVFAAGLIAAGRRYRR